MKLIKKKFAIIMALILLMLLSISTSTATDDFDNMTFETQETLESPPTDELPETHSVSENNSNTLYSKNQNQDSFYLDELAPENQITTYSTKISTSFTSQNYVLNHKGLPFCVILKDSYGNPLINTEVAFTINGVTYYRTSDDNGVAKLNINLNNGVYPISFSYSGNANYYGCNGQNTISMVSYALSSSLKGNDLTKYYGDGEKYTVQLKDNNGQGMKNTTVSMAINGVTYTRITDDNGIASININLFSGTYTIQTTFSGNSYYYSSSTTNKIVVNKKPTKIIGSDLTKYYGDSTPYKVQLVDNQGKPMANRDIIFSINGVDYVRVTDNSGYAYLNINLFAGTYTIRASFEGDYYYSTFVINKIVIVNKKATTLTCSDLTKYRGDPTLSIIHLHDDQGKPMANKNIELLIDGMNITLLTDELGCININIDLNAGVYIITAKFAGDFYYSGSSCSFKVTINKKATSLTGNSLTKYYGDTTPASVRLLDYQGNPMKNTDINFKINGADYIRTTDNNGYAKLNITLFAGTYTLTATYTGDYHYSSSTCTLQITVNKKTTSFIGNNLIKYQGDKTPFSLTLIDNQGNKLSNKNIIFTINDIDYIKTTNNLGVAQLNITLNPGNHILSATFDGDYYYSSFSKQYTIEIKSPSDTEFYIFSQNVNAGERFYFGLFEKENNNPLANQKVILSLNNQNYTITTNEKGIGNFLFKISSGLTNISLHYAGSNIYKPISSYGIINLNYEDKVISLENIIKSAVSLKDYINNNLILPNKIVVNNENLTIYEFSYAMAKAIININNNNLSDIVIPLIYKESDYIDSNCNITLTLYSYTTIINNILLFSENNGYMPINFTYYDKFVDFKTYTYAFSNILAFYNITTKLPIEANFNTYIAQYLNYTYNSNIEGLIYGSGLNEINKEDNIEKYLINGTYCEQTKLVTDTLNLIINGITGEMEKAKIIYEFVRNIPYASYAGAKGVNYILQESKGNSIDKTNLLIALCRATNIPAKYNSGYAIFNPSGFNLSNTWAQILIDNIWYIADATSSRNSIGFVANWNADSITNLKQGNLYLNMTSVSNVDELTNKTVNYPPYTFSDDDSYNIFNSPINTSVSFDKTLISEINTKISFGNTAIKYGFDYLSARLTNTKNIPLANKKIKFTINNQIYESITDLNGIAVLNIANLKPDQYTVSYSFEGDAHYNSCQYTKNINIVKSEPTIDTDKKEISAGNNIIVLLKDYTGSPIANQTVQMIINSKAIDLKTDLFGSAVFNNTLTKGTYQAICYFKGSDCYYPCNNIFTLNVKDKSIIQANDTIIHNNNIFEILLTDFENNVLKNKLITSKIIDCENNLIKTINLTTNNEGKISIPISSLKPGMYSIFYSFEGDEDYLSSYSTSKLNIVADNIKINTNIEYENSNNYKIHQRGDYLVGRLVDDYGNPLKNYTVDINLFLTGGGVSTYTKTSDENGYFKLQINLNPNQCLTTLTKFNGDETYNLCLKKLLLNVSHTPSFQYTINITTLNTVTFENGKILNIPYGREIGIYKNGVLHKFTYGYTSSGATKLDTDKTYFLSLSDNLSLTEIQSFNDIKSHGITLQGNGKNVLITYHGYKSENFTALSAIFNGKNYHGKQISEVTLIQNNIAIASLYFSSEITTSTTRSYLNSKNYDPNYMYYHPIKTSFLEIPEFFILNQSLYEDIFYGNTNYNDLLTNANWNKNLGYEFIESYLLVNRKEIDTQTMTTYLNKYNDYSGATQVAYNLFLTNLAYRWLADKLATEISEKYGVEWFKYPGSLSGTKLNYKGMEFTILDGTQFSSSDEYAQFIAKRDFSIKGSLLEQYIVQLNGFNSTCAVNEVFNALFTGESFYYYNTSEGHELKLADNSSKLVFHQNGISSIIYPDKLDDKYTLNGGKSLGGFLFDNFFGIVNNLIEIIPTYDEILDLISNTFHLNQPQKAILNYVSDFLLSEIGTALIFAGLGVGALTIGSLPLALVTVGVGVAFVLESNDAIKDPSPINLAYSAGDVLLGGLHIKGMEKLGKLGLKGTGEKFIDYLSTIFITSVEDTTKEIYNYIYR